MIGVKMCARCGATQAQLHVLSRSGFRRLVCVSTRRCRHRRVKQARTDQLTAVSTQDKGGDGAGNGVERPHDPA